MILSYLELAYNALKARKLRSWLTLLGIFIGITAVVALFSLGSALQKGINERFKELGTDKIIVSLPSRIGFSAYSAAKLTKDDMKVIKKVRGVKQVAEVAIGNFKVEFNNKQLFMNVRGVPTEEKSYELAQEVIKAKVASGRDLKKNDKYKALVGYRLTKEDNPFGKAIQVGDKVKINGVLFKIVGTIQRTGNYGPDSILYIPIDTLRELFNDPEKRDFIIVRTLEGYDIRQVAERIKQELRKARNVEKGQEDFSVQTFEKIFESFLTIFTIVKYVILGLTAISLIVGALGIMNTMYTAVSERTKEIGTFMAIGAKRWQVFFAFFVESGLLGLVAGIIGIASGMLIAIIVKYIAEYFDFGLLSLTFPPWLVISMLAFSFFIGSASGTYPAIKAAKLQPLEALRK